MLQTEDMKTAYLKPEDSKYAFMSFKAPFESCQYTICSIQLWTSVCFDQSNQYSVALA